MPATPTIYRWDDAGAPAPTDKRDALYQVLKACLVDGYGSQPPAGWSVVYDAWSTQRICTLQNAGQSGVLGMVRCASTSWGATLFVADAMIDAAHAVTARSGTSEISDIPGLASTRGGLNHFSGYSNRYKNWIVIANNNFVIAFFAENSSVFSRQSNLLWWDMEVFAAGSFASLRGLGSVSAPSIGNFCLIGSALSGDSTVAWSVTMAVVVSDSTGAVAQGAAYGYVWPWCLQSADVLGYSVAAAGSLVDLPLLSAELWSGSANGIANAYQLGTLPMIRSNTRLTGSSVIAYANVISPGRINDVIDVDGRPGVLVNMPDSSGGTAFVSLALEDWV